MDGLENNVKKSNAMKQIIRERNPESKFGMNSKEVYQDSRNNYDDINTGHDKCFIALGKEMSRNEYQDIHDLIASTANDNVPHEERGNRADDEKDSERIINSPEPVDLDQELDKLEMIEKTKRILDNSDTIIDRAKIVLAEIIIEEKDNDDISQMQWNKVEIW